VAYGSYNCRVSRKLFAHSFSFSFVHSFACCLDTSSLSRHLRMRTRVCLVGSLVKVDVRVIRMRVCGYV
jgi:hypothetical protein